MIDAILKFAKTNPMTVILGLVIILAAGGIAGGLYINTLNERIEAQRVDHERELAIEQERSKLAIDSATHARSVCETALGMLGSKARSYDGSRTQLEQALADLDNAIVPSCKPPTVAGAIERLQRQVAALADDAESVQRVQRLLEPELVSERTSSIATEVRASAYRMWRWIASGILLGIAVTLLYVRVRGRPGKQ
jgi:hypothetical protein